MEKFFGCPYDKKKGRPYFDTRAKYGRAADSIVIWFAYTPTGRVSKYWHTLRFNADYYGEINDEELERLVQKTKINSPKLGKGYTWSKPYRYS